MTMVGGGRVVHQRSLCSPCACGKLGARLGPRTGLAVTSLPGLWPPGLGLCIGERPAWLCRQADRAAGGGTGSSPPRHTPDPALLWQQPPNASVPSCPLLLACLDGIPDDKDKDSDGGEHRCRQQEARGQRGGRRHACRQPGAAPRSAACQTSTLPCVTRPCCLQTAWRTGRTSECCRRACLPAGVCLPEGCACLKGVPRLGAGEGMQEACSATTPPGRRALKRHQPAC